MADVARVKGPWTLSRGIQRSYDDDGGVSADEESRIIYFTSSVDSSTTAEAIASLFNFATKAPDEPVWIVIDTYGGSVHSMFALYDAIKYVPCPVYTIALGKVMSSGVLILAAGEKGHRYIGPNTRIMTHPAMMSTSGNVFELTNELAELNENERMWVEAMSVETGLSVEQLTEMNSRPTDVYVSATDAIKLGIADRLLYKPERPTRASKKTTKRRRKTSARSARR